MQFIKPEWLIIISQFAWFHVHGFPPIIYLFLNKTIREDCRLFFFKIFKSNKVNQVNGVTILVKPGIII
uniref:Uncharacterized protein n=1 Tax=Meloidogyne incognita TaxID=6306 RepID=A0A914MF95_MELIC